MSKKVVRVCVLVIAVFLVACDSATAPLPVSAYRAKWEAQNIQDYSYTGRAACVFCDYSGRDVKVVVHSGAVVSATDVSTGDPTDVAAWLPIPQLFDELEAVLADEAFRVTVVYDAVLGYPRMVRYSCREEVPDCGFSRTITDLAEIGQPDVVILSRMNAAAD
jgi:hypothetical protein